MARTEIVREQVERRTYFKGKFVGKYWADPESEYSDGVRENFFRMNIYEGEVHARATDFKKWYEGDKVKGFKSVDVFDPALPKELTLTVSDNRGNTRKFKAPVYDAKLINYRLYNRQLDDDQSFGTIEGLISGYLVHYEEIEREIEIQEQLLEEAYAAASIPAPRVWKTEHVTGNKETKPGYERYEYYYSDGSTYWGDWLKVRHKSTYSFWDIVISLLLLCLALAIIVPFLISSWKILLALAGIYLLFTFFSAAGTIFRFLGTWLLRLLSFGFLLLFMWGLFHTFNDGHRPKPTPDVDDIADNSDDQTSVEPDPQNPQDSIISHTRNWKDYRNNKYSTKLKVLTKDFRESEGYRNTYGSNLNTTSAYNQLMKDFHRFDRGKLNMIYAAFDSLRQSHQLNDYEFAEMVVSCVQNIPYVLLLPQACNAQQYNDDFIQSYLGKGGQCDGFIKYGIRNPVEFMATLKGDCDTRTLMVFTVLNHFKYDVAILGSEMYSHSILGINLPYRGLSKAINGRQYIVWETTAPNFKPGDLPREISDMRYWSANLISR
jgi:hypothetical protein